MAGSPDFDEVLTRPSRKARPFPDYTPGTVRNLGRLVRGNRKVIALFVLMVLLPAAVFSVLIVRALRGEEARTEYDKQQRQRRIVRLVEADLRNWLFSATASSARAEPVLTFEVQGDRVVFPAFALSLAAGESPPQRPFDSGPPSGPLTPDTITSQYFPRIEAFRRDLAAGRNAGAQYFPRLQALIVQPPGDDDGYVVDIERVLAHVNGTLTDLSDTEAFIGQAWMPTDRSAQRPADAFSLEALPFLGVVFEDRPNGFNAGIVAAAFPYAMSLLVLVTVLGSVFVYRAVSQEARLARLRSDFVAAVSHEFRSPLSSIVALAERLESSRVHDPQKLTEYHRLIGQDARRLSTLVARLLDFAQIEEGKAVYARERIDLVAAAKEAADACRHAGRPDRISVLGAESAPLWVSADRTALHHSIQNVIENAAKYSPPDAPVLVRCGSANGFHVVEVIDRGVGIPAAEQDRIFEKFYRGQHAAGMHVQGVGIGLALVKHVIDSHGGSIVVDSDPGRGSRFSLRFPRA